MSTLGFEPRTGSCASNSNSPLHRGRLRSGVDVRYAGSRRPGRRRGHVRDDNADGVAQRSGRDLAATRR